MKIEEFGEVHEYVTEARKRWRSLRRRMAKHEIPEPDENGVHLHASLKPRLAAPEPVKAAKPRKRAAFMATPRVKPAKPGAKKQGRPQFRTRVAPDPAAKKYRGVSYHDVSGRYAAQIYGAGPIRWLGLFDTPEEAARAWDRKAVEVRGPGTFVNFPERHGAAS